MASKVCGLLCFIALVTAGSCLTQIFLEDEHITFVTNPLIGKSLTIPKFIFDTLLTCHVVFPNGRMVEAFPINEINDPYVFFMSTVEPHRGCAIGIRGAPSTHSGTYELYSVVNDWAGAGLTLTRKKFHLTLVESEVEFPLAA